MKSIIIIIILSFIICGCNNSHIVDSRSAFFVISNGPILLTVRDKYSNRSYVFFKIFCKKKNNILKKNLFLNYHIVDNGYFSQIKFTNLQSVICN